MCTSDWKWQLFDPSRVSVASTIVGSIAVKPFLKNGRVGTVTDLSMSPEILDPTACGQMILHV